MPEDGTTSFEDLGLIEPLLRAIREEGYLRPTAIQEKGIPHVLAGSDLLGCAQTGTGKTAAFALPILQVLSAGPAHGHAHHVIRALILTPTRELAAQIGDSLTAYGRHVGLRHAVIYGGVPQGPQASALHRGVDIVVATPGRLLDLMGQKLVKLRGLEMLVLDEADRMLDMGFIPDVRRIVSALPTKRQTLFFSATLSPDIQRLAGGMVRDPVHVDATPASATVETVEQRVYLVEAENKRALLEHLLKAPEIVRALVFTGTKHGADRVARQLHRAGVQVHAIHGNKSQSERQRTLARFKRGELRVLVATDVAARGLDINSVSHVINMDIPAVPEAYVHRIGRTARADTTGVAVSFCSPDERGLMAAIERLIRVHMELIVDHPFHPRDLPPYSYSAAPAKPASWQSRSRGRPKRRK